jgi:hypothetical protein
VPKDDEYLLQRVAINSSADGAIEQKLTTVNKSFGISLLDEKCMSWKMPSEKVLF